MNFSTTGKMIFALCAAPVLASSVPSAQATTSVPTNFTVSATVQATCTISASALAFGTYTGLAATGTSTVTVQCTNTTPYNVALSAGSGSGSTVTTRKMTGPSSATLNYALYQDSARSVNWGMTTGTDTESGTGNGSTQALTVYGAITAGQYVAPGAYSDTITATVIY